MISFSVTALVHDPSEDLCMSARYGRNTRQITRSGIVTQGLLYNEKLSVALAPDAWSPSEKGIFKFRPKSHVPTPPLVYDVPTDLGEESPTYQLEGMEVNWRGRSCQIVTGYEGERVHPYRRVSDRFATPDQHPSVSIFSASELGMLVWEKTRRNGQPYGILRATRARIGVEDGLLVVRHECVFGYGKQELATHRLGTFPAEHEAWNPPLQALYERMLCKERSCDGHFHE